MLFAEVADTSAALAATPSRNAKTRLLAQLLTRAAAEAAASGDVGQLGLVVRYLSGTLRQRRTGIELSSWGSLPRPARVASVTVSEVDSVLDQAAGLSGTGSATTRAVLFDAVMARLTEAEQRLLVGLLRGGLRQGALESAVLAAVAAASGAPLEQVRRAVTVSGSLPAVAVRALIEGPAALSQFGLTVGVPVSPMLAGSARTVAEAVQRTGPAAVEWKLDGIRAQVHKDGDRVGVYTRSLEEITDRVPEVGELLAGLPVAHAIFDGELIALHPDGRPRPFQQTGSRTASRGDPRLLRARTPLTTFLFDVLHLDGQDLLDEPGQVRRAALERVVPPSSLTPRVTVTDPGDAAAVSAANAFADDAVTRGHEGVVVKSLSAAYQMGRRGAGWVKVKPVHTFDLVILAVERGSGRRSGWLSNLHLGARDPAGRYGPPGGFVMLGKTFKGLTDAMLRWQTETLPRYAEGPTDGYVVRLRPEVVVEIALDGVQTSPRYPAGVALRFARVVRHRPDKRAQEADVIQDVLRLSPHDP
ncbi:MAG TPA: ATP-dependent DNA ligase [Dermatophilaceae bacterium]|nr:ATP-dependent DNA ligase [Dermatophilaceae bacterium]